MPAQAMPLVYEALNLKEIAKRRGKNTKDFAKETREVYRILQAFAAKTFVVASVAYVTARWILAEDERRTR